MLIFQMNPNQINMEDEGLHKKWLFWNSYLNSQLNNPEMENKFALLPPFIDFVTNTDIITDSSTYMLELDNEEENDDGGEEVT